MSLVKRRVSARKVAANQANAQKSTGPKTAEGKARVALNGLKGGAYAKSDTILRLIMRRRGEEPKDFEQVHQDLVDSWHPDDAMQAMVVKTIADKTWEKLELRRESLESQLTAFQCGQIGTMLLLGPIDGFSISGSRRNATMKFDVLEDAEGDLMLLVLEKPDPPCAAYLVGGITKQVGG